MEKGDAFKAWLFVILLLTFIVGGFILMKKSSEILNDQSENRETDPSEESDIKLDKTKDFIYYTNNDEIVHELDLVYKDINFNFKDNEGISKKLNEESLQLKQTLSYDENNEDAPYNHLVSAKYKIYTTYTYGNYISLIVDYYEYQYETLVSFINSKTYVFDKKTGDLITSDKLLNDFKLTSSEVLDKVKSHIVDEDIAKAEEELDEESTIAGITEMALFVDKIGRLSISVLVKSDQKDYNEIIILN